jgi:hypothetical protein
LAYPQQVAQRHVTPSFQASSPTALKQTLEADLQAIGHNPALTSAARYERRQLWRFLCAAAETDLL